MIHRVPLAGIATTAALLAIPAGAAAVTLTPNKPCYSRIPTVGSEPIAMALTGGTPGGRFLVSATGPGRPIGSSGSVSGDFDAAGNATTQLQGVTPPSGTISPTKGERVVLSVQDFAAGTPGAPLAQVLVTTVALDVSSRPRNPFGRRLVRVSGTPFAGQRLYGFIVRGSSRRVLRRVSLGRANACGYASSRQVVAPRNRRRGNYRFYVNVGRRLDKPKALRFNFRIFGT